MLFSFSIAQDPGTSNQGVRSQSSAASAGVVQNWANMPQIRSAVFSGPDRAWLVSEKDGELLFTEDGGGSWRKLPAPQVGRFGAVDFIDSQRGWAIGLDGRIWQSKDSGRTWSVLGDVQSANREEIFSNTSQITFTDELQGWLIATFAIWHTQDGGVTWKQSFRPSGRAQGQPGRGFFPTAMVGWVCGTDGELYSTRDGGKTWQIQVIGTDRENSHFNDVYFVNEELGWLCSIVNGHVYHSKDGGKTWQLSPIGAKGTYIYSFAFLNEREGWAVGRSIGEAKRGPQRGVVLHTSDGGQTWKEIDVGENEAFFDLIRFVDDQHGWLFARNNVYRTANGGKSWQVVLRLPTISNGAAIN